MTLMLMDYYSTAAKVDMKYDFTFDGKQGRCIYVFASSMRVFVNANT